MVSFKNQLQLFSTTDYAKVVKVLIGVFTSFVIAQFFHFSSVSTSASTVLVILMSSNETSSRSYLRRRAISQFLGVPIAMLFYYLINLFPGIPPFFRPAITVTIAVWAALMINLYFHIVRQWTSLIIAVFIVISFEAQNPGYPIQRIEQVLLGILLGYLIHRFILPVHVFARAKSQFIEVSKQYFDTMEILPSINKTNITLDKDVRSMITANLAKLDKSLLAVQEDINLKTYNRYDKHYQSFEIIQACNTMMKNVINTYDLFENFPTFYRNLRPEFKACFITNLTMLLKTHQKLSERLDTLQIEDIQPVHIKTIHLENKTETILMSRIYEYEATLNQLIMNLDTIKP